MNSKTNMMDYKIFHRENDYPIMLNTEEIEQPFRALEALLSPMSCDEFQQSLEDLLHAQLKPFGWKEYGPPVRLYQTYNKLKKLLDILWVINTCCRRKDIQPKLPYAERRKIQQYYKRSFTGLFKRTPTDIKEIPSLDPYLTLVEFFNEEQLTTRRNTISLWTYMAFSSSYMLVLDDLFFGICGEANIQDYRCISGMIAAAYQLKTMKLNARVMRKLSKYKIFAIDFEHPETFEEMEIIEPRMVLDYVHHYMDSRKLPQVLQTWHDMLSSTDHWQHHNDPGNVLYLKETLVQQIETAWMLMVTESDKTHKVKDNSALINPLLFSELNGEEQSNPFLVIDQFFDFQNLCAWKHVLEDWLYGSLTDKNEEVLLKSVITKETCKQLLKLLQALYLIDKRFD